MKAVIKAHLKGILLVLGIILVNLFALLDSYAFNPQVSPDTIVGPCYQAERRCNGHITLVCIPQETCQHCVRYEVGCLDCEEEIGPVVN